MTAEEKKNIKNIKKIIVRLQNNNVKLLMFFSEPMTKKI